MKKKKKIIKNALYPFLSTLFLENLCGVKFPSVNGAPCFINRSSLKFCNKNANIFSNTHGISLVHTRIRTILRGSYKQCIFPKQDISDNLSNLVGRYRSILRNMHAHKEYSPSLSRQTIFKRVNEKPIVDGILTYCIGQ